MEYLTRAASIFLPFGVVLLIGSYMVWRKNAECPRSLLQRFFRVGVVCVVMCGMGMLVKRVYFDPRYGGIGGYVLEGVAAGSQMRQAEGELERLRSALALYYGETGRYPQTLDVLWQGQKYLSRPPLRPEICIEGKNGMFHLAHWYRDTNNKVTFFFSRAESDDGGGWGYVTDPRSPEWGTVFVNCKHLHWEQKVPWNLWRRGPIVRLSS